MFFDIFFSLLFLVIAGYLLINIFVNTVDFEYSLMKWFKRTFKICKHNNTKLYFVSRYFTADDGPRVIYNVMCGNCDKKIGQYIVPVANILDLNLKTVEDGEWHILTEEEFAVFKKCPHHVGIFY